MNSYERIRVALVAPLISKSATGLSSYIADLVPHLCDAGHQVTVVASDCGYRGAKSDDLVEIDRRAALKLFPVTGRVDRRLYRSREMARWFQRSVSQFDVVDIQGTWSWIAADIAGICRKARVGYVLTPHGMMTRWDWRKQLLMKRIFFATKLRPVWRSASAVRFLSTGELEGSMVAPESPHVIIPNAIETPTNNLSFESHTIRGRLCLQNDAPVVLFLGRITDQKGVLELLQAFCLLRRECPRAQLVIAGPLEGAYGTMVRQYAEEKGRGSIHILGPVFGQAKYALFATASLFVTLSKNEGLSIAALEALAMGVPVAVTRQSNLPEAEAGGAGVTTLCEPRVAARDIAGLLNDPTRLAAMASNARAVAERHFSWRAVLPRLLDLYTQVASGRPSRPTGTQEALS